MSTRGLKFITREKLLQSFLFLSSSDNSKETIEAVKWNSKGKVRNTSYFHFSIATFLRKELKFYWTYKVSLKLPPSFISKPTNFFCPKTFPLSSFFFFFLSVAKLNTVFSVHCLCCIKWNRISGMYGINKYFQTQTHLPFCKLRNAQFSH